MRGRVYCSAKAFSFAWQYKSDNNFQFDHQQSKGHSSYEIVQTIPRPRILDGLVDGFWCRLRLVVTRGRVNACSMLGQRLRRWPNIEQALCKTRVENPDGDCIVAIRISYITALIRNSHLVKWGAQKMISSFSIGFIVTSTLSLDPDQRSESESYFNTVILASLFSIISVATNR